jgi:hypothetical protein
MKKLLTLIAVTSGFLSLNIFATITFKNNAKNPVELIFESKKVAGGIDTLDVGHEDTASLHDYTLNDLTSLKIRTFGLPIQHTLDIGTLKNEAMGCKNPKVIINPKLYGYEAYATCPAKLEEEWEIIERK